MNKYQQMIMLCSLVSLELMAGQAVDQTLPASNSSFVQIEHVNGRAEIRGWDKDSVQVKGELGEDTEEFTFREKGGDIRIKVEVKQRRRSWGDIDGDELVIYVPFGASVDYDSVNASVDIADLRGNSKVEVVNGSVEAADLSGRVRLESVNGEISFNNITGDTTAETVNGDIQGKHMSDSDIQLMSVNGSIEVESLSQDIVAESVNGDIELGLASVDSLEMTTVNGDIEVELTLKTNAEVEANSVGGRMTLKFVHPVSAHFDIEAHAGGKIVNRITDDEMQKAKYGPRRWLDFTTGKGEASVNLSTVNGRITIE